MKYSLTTRFAVVAGLSILAVVPSRKRIIRNGLVTFTLSSFFLVPEVYNRENLWNIVLILKYLIIV